MTKLYIFYEGTTVVRELHKPRLQVSSYKLKSPMVFTDSDLVEPVVNNRMHFSVGNEHYFMNKNDMVFIRK